MKALISPTEQVISYDGTVLGARVAEVAVTPFEVAPPLFWVECADDVVADQFYYADGALIPVPVKPEPAPALVAAGALTIAPAENG